MAAPRDIASFSGARNVVTLTQPTAQSFADQLRSALIGAGWSQQATIADTFGTGYKMLSQVSPWYAAGSPPAAYDNQIKLSIRLSSSNVVILQPSNDSESMIQSLGNSMSYSVGSIPEYFVGNNYQFFLMSLTASVALFYAGALQLSEAEQDVAGPAVESALIGGDFFGWRDGLDVNAARQWRGYKASGVESTYEGSAAGQARLGICSLGSKVTHQTNRLDGFHVWDPNVDTTMADSSLSPPLALPPIVYWGIANNSAAAQMVGFLWDAFVVFAGMNRDTEIIGFGHTWLAIQDANFGKGRRPGTIMLCIAPETEFCG